MSKLTKGVDLTPGKVQVTSGWLQSSGKKFRAYEFDLRTKYAQIAYLVQQESTYIDGAVEAIELGREVEVVLEAGERTRNADGPDGLTVLTFKVPTRDRWSIIADCSRYTVRVVLYR